MPLSDSGGAHSARPRRTPPLSPLRQVLDRTFASVGRTFLEQVVRELSEVLELDLVWLEIGPEGALEEGGPFRLCWPASIVPPFEASATLIECEPGRLHFLDCESVEPGSNGRPQSPLWDTTGGLPFEVEGVGRAVLAFADTGELDPSLMDPYLLLLLAERLGAEARRMFDDRWLHGGLGRDPRTGLPGRRLFLDRVEGAVHRALRSDQRVVLIDVAIDDGGLGPAQREELVAAVGDRLRGAVRRCDAVGRLATARFGVLLEGIREWRYVEAVALSVYHSLTHSPLDGDLRLRATAGVAVFPDDGPDGLVLIENARRARLQIEEGLSFASVGRWR